MTPSYIPLVPGTEVPDWNSEAFLSGYERLVAALGAKYANDPRLGYVDVGGYGKYGEWWVDRTDPRITKDNGLRLVRAVNKAFPNKTIVFNTMQTIKPPFQGPGHQPADGPAHRQPRRAGDVLHGDRPHRHPPARRMEDAPVLQRVGHHGRCCPVLGADQVRTYHVSTTSSHNMRLTYDNMTSTQKAAYESAVKSAGYRYAVTKATVSPITAGQQFRVDLTVDNVGSAPTYQPWTVRLVLRDGTGHRGATFPMSVDLRKHLPGTKTSTVYLTAPKLATGTYRTFIEAVRPSGYSAPLHWLNGPRYSDGTYALGTVDRGRRPAGRVRPVRHLRRDQRGHLRPRGPVRRHRRQLPRRPVRRSCRRHSKGPGAARHPRARSPRPCSRS